VSEVPGEAVAVAAPSAAPWAVILAAGAERQAMHRDAGTILVGVV
jgi:hypothetical protein